MADLLESIARAIHEDYVRQELRDGRTPADNSSLLAWSELPETLRLSNRRQAADIESKLAAISCEVSSTSKGRTPVSEFSPDEVEQLAKMEHERWEAERRADGWTYGSVKDTRTKRSPNLVPWEDLTEDARELDRDAVRRIPRLLEMVNLLVLRTPATRGEHGGA